MSISREESRPDAGRALLAFTAAIFVLHQLPAFAGEGAGDWIDLVTPFAVIGAAVFLLGRGAPALALAVAVVGALLYVDGHGIHLSANSIDYERLTGDAREDTHFWDEEWGHLEWHVGWFVLIAGLCLAERARPVRVGRWAGVVSAVLLAWVLFTSTVEGGTWWLELAATAVFVPWAVARRRPLLVVCAAAFALCALMIGVWAIWQGGVPQFSEVDLIE
jgi:hypothetical protein